MKIATFNVNSINARIENLCKWLKSDAPDIVLLQEIKSEFNNFPFFELQTCGYNAAILGQKSYNGVAVLSRGKIKVIHENLPSFPDEQARFLEADIILNNHNYRVASVYVPNGNPPYNNAADTSKFDYKLRWMDAFVEHVKSLSQISQPTIIGGDFNVIMSAKDVWDTKPFIGNALFRSEVQNRLKKLAFYGFYDAFRCLSPDDSGYTFWDYTSNSFQADYGMRIDYLWLNAPAVDNLISCIVDKNPRQNDKPSDHTPLIAELTQNV